MSEKYDVTIKAPKGEEKRDFISLTGVKSKLDGVIKALDELREGYEAQAHNAYLASFKIEIEIPLNFHPKIIGRNGENVTKLRDEHNVNIQFPNRPGRKEYQNQNRENTSSECITITGYKDKVEECANALQKICDELQQHVSKGVEIDQTVHSRIIGGRGRGIRKLMNEHDVEIKFPRSSESDPNIVTVTGSSENVDIAIDALTNLEEEFMQEGGREEEVIDSQYKPRIAAQSAMQAIYDREDNKKDRRPAKNTKNAAQGDGKQQVKQVNIDIGANQGAAAQPKKNMKAGSGESFPSLANGNSNEGAKNIGAWGAGRF